MCALNCQNTDWSVTERMLFVLESKFFFYLANLMNIKRIYNRADMESENTKEQQKGGWMKIGKMKGKLRDPVCMSMCTGFLTNSSAEFSYTHMDKKMFVFDEKIICNYHY